MLFKRLLLKGRNWQDRAEIGWIGIGLFIGDVVINGYWPDVHVVASWFCDYG